MNPPTKPGESFSALFEREAPTGRTRDAHVGDELRATVVHVGRESVFLESDRVRQAYIDASELRAPDGTLTVRVGDQIEVYVVEIDPRTGGVRAGRTIRTSGSAAALAQARETGLGVQGKVTGVNKGGLDVDVGGVRAFCPNSQADARFFADAGSMVGKTFTFAVTEVRDGGKSVVVSRRVIVEREERERFAHRIRDLVPGATTRGTITGVREFGAFVDLGGVEGLIPHGEITHDRSASIGDLLKAGDVVDVRVREVKAVTSSRPGEATTRITLSMKALVADPWDAIESVLHEGQVIRGNVARVVEFGVFVRLAAGIEGLLHISELVSSPDQPAPALKQGQSIAVVVERIEREARRLVLVPAPAGASEGEVVRRTEFLLGSVVHGTVGRIESYGVFVQVAGTAGRAGRGLIPNAELGIARGADVRKHFREMTEVSAKVLEVGDGRLRLSIRAMREDEERAQFEGFRDTVAAPAKLGTLGDLMARKRR